MWNLTMLLCILWVVSLLYGEMLTFWVPSIWSCSWPPLLRSTSLSSSAMEAQHPGNYVKIAVVADPQLMDKTSLGLPPKSLALEISQFYTDLFMRRAFLASILPLKPDAILFLGDYFDGGPSLSDEEWKESSSRFKHIFDLKTQGKRNIQVYHLSGNHDIGYASVLSHKPECWFRVWCMGVCSFEGKKLQLEWWRPEAGCFREGAYAKEFWVRLIRLPLHLWGKDFFTRVGDARGGFVAVDMDTTERRHLQWARILVISNRRRVPGILHVVVESSVFVLESWWEIPPWVLVVISTEGCRVMEVRDDCEGRPRTEWSVGIEVWKRAKRLELPKNRLCIAQVSVGTPFSAYSRDLGAGGQVEGMVFRPLFWLKWGWWAKQYQGLFLLQAGRWEALSALVVRRYEQEFGIRNYRFTVGKVEFVVVDAQTLDGHSQGSLTSASWDFIKNVSMDVNLNPRVLLTHIPLYRPDWTTCGPYRYSPVINQVLILSGHDHDQCTVTHMSKHGPVMEHTVGTISWQQGNLYPSFMLLSASNDTIQNDSSLQDAISTQLCFLPMQTHIYIWYLFQFVLTLLALLLWPTNGLGSWRHCRVFMEYTRSLISSNILRSGAKEKNEDENCEYEMIWDAEGSMHLVKKTSKAPLTRSSERGLSERGNAVMRSTAKRQISQETELSTAVDMNMDVELDMMAKLPPRASKSRTKKVIRRLMRTLRMLTVIAAVNVPLYMMLLFKDWTEQ
ncbi:uncharacterized protein LOC100256904 isoform X3 [Vitis vinifera]|uniref:uncharacterized protein LOC100256904 isoform X3 n=1 Tax=Vitis vinifera TaxID=29760 RepID=UPI00053F2A90|nr:uncharacterized protein LOC100256904 isoform X3 [Vitis vinifera]|eukprot:XP_010649316.1 PREDICTED: uncharacterized protein LOC100256904 isoform X3 [Vitis vinifera]